MPLTDISQMWMGILTFPRPMATPRPSTPPSALAHWDEVDRDGDQDEADETNQEAVITCETRRCITN